MKAPFRFFRGELNGYYILAFLLSRNSAIADILAELVYQALVAWALPGSEGSGELPIRDDDLTGIAQFAGIVRPVQYYQNVLGSLQFTDSHIVAAQEYSERGLYNMTNESFDFVRTDPSIYADDIVTAASANERMSVVPHGTAILGYEALGSPLFDSAGAFIPANLLSSPPGGGVPYSEYYGDKFLTLENDFTTAAYMSITMFKSYYECVMRIRKEGASIKELLFLTQLLCEGYVYDLEVVPYLHYYKLYYSVNAASSVDNKHGRFATWEKVIEKRFPDFVTVER
jgi:hypothetical protein